jgi:uncharacterized protein (TIGR03435 family)
MRKGAALSVTGLLMLAASGAHLSAQGGTAAGALQSPAYVASIRHNTSPDARPVGGQGRRPDGFIVTAITPAVFIGMAYDQYTFGRIIGLPDWTARDRYDISIKTTGAWSDWKAPLRNVLRDRFGMRSHVERRSVPTYALVQARSDGRLGPRLTPAAIDCDDTAAVAAAQARKAAGAPLCNGVSSATRIWFSGMRIGSLANALAGIVNRPVLDRTGLSAHYDIDLQYTPMADFANPNNASDRVSIFTALREQLGLELEPQNADLDVLVVDALERPDDN